MGAAFDLATALARALVFICALQAAGALVFLARLPADSAATRAIVGRVVAWSAGIGIFFVVLRSVLEPMRMAGSAAGAVDPLLVELFWASNVGLAQIARLAGFAACLGLCIARPTSRSAAWTAAALVALSFALMGHTRSHEGGGVFGALLTIHLLAAAYWFGALLPLHVALGRESGERLIGIVRDFSRRAVWLVPTMALAGAVIAWRLLGSLASFATPYGALLLVKIGGFTALAALGALNRFLLMPALARRPQSAVAAFRRVIRAELAIMVAVLVATAVMTTLYSPEPAQA